MRVTCTSSEEMEFAVVARRLAEVPLLDTFPQQPSYSTIWSGGKSGYVHYGESTPRQRMLRAIDRLAPRLLRQYHSFRTRPINQPKYFRQVDI